MRPQFQNAGKGGALRRGLWRAVFCIGAAPLIGCVVVIAANPLSGATPWWVYALALGSAIVCVVAAVQLRSYERYDAIDEGAWLARAGTRGAKSEWDDLGGLDD